MDKVKGILPSTRIDYTQRAPEAKREVPRDWKPRFLGVHSRVGVPTEDHCYMGLVIQDQFEKAHNELSAYVESGDIGSARTEFVNLNKLYLMVQMYLPGSTFTDSISPEVERLRSALWEESDDC